MISLCGAVDSSEAECQSMTITEGIIAFMTLCINNVWSIHFAHVFFKCLLFTVGLLG